MAETEEQRLARVLRARGRTLAVAESCTGGGIAASITDVPGVSECFLGGIVAYQNEAKTRLLGVDSELLSRHGAVSDAVAGAMARGVCSVFGADLGIATTGIAGPGGGSDRKPVGLVFIAIAGEGHAEVHRRQFSGDRDEVRQHAVRCALALAADFVENEPKQNHASRDTGPQGVNHG